LEYQAAIREVINGSAFALLVVLTSMIGIFLWDSYFRTAMTTTAWRKDEGVAVACVLWWIFGSEAYRTFNVWFAYVRAPPSVGVGIFGVSSGFSTVGYLTAGIILNMALLAGIYRFTPPDWKKPVWIYAVLLAISLVSTPFIIDYCCTRT
jgi:hypothetical protein